MPGKRLQFDDEPWRAIEAVARQSDRSFQELKADYGRTPSRGCHPKCEIIHKELAIPRQGRTLKNRQGE